MKFQFENLHDFLTMPNPNIPLMPDHGVYVWPCYLLGAAVIAWLTLGPVLRRRRYLAELFRRERLAEQQSQQQANFSE